MKAFSNEQVEAILRDSMAWHYGDKWRHCSGVKKTAWDERDALLKAQLRTVVKARK